MRKSGRMRDSEKYAVLAEILAPEHMQEGTRVNHADVGAYRTKLIRAGDFIYISCYPLINAYADAKQRMLLMELEQSKNKRLMMKFAKYNNARRIKKFEQLVHANFEKGDLHIVCTYEIQDLESGEQLEYITRKEADRNMYNFIRKIRYLLKKQGCDLKAFRWIAVTVTKERMKEVVKDWPDSHHHHILMHGVPEELRTTVENLWKFGYCNADRLRDSNEGFADVSAYVAKQEGSANGENRGAKSFRTSKNIVRPEVSTNDSKISRARVAKIAADMRVNGKEILEKLYAGYRLVEDVRVEVSEFVAGAYIYAKLRRIQNTAARKRQ